ncbi:kelch-like protein 24 isoform X2 [Triplophysa dalaica]|uniref:kelch-like protein 24 isoform X2 n=1 Tax=Triplophysa dalaica TaxID=1582913 RepID=UPI0024DFE9CF|nr:kelch-like protein 24 isoform X2 [Triplophysa dalaica]
MGFGINSELIDSRSEVILCSGSSHAENILMVLNAYRRSGTFTDVVLWVDGCEFPCHRATLCASSPFFHAMFCGSFQESKQTEVKLEGISRKAMEHLLDFLYEGKLNLDEEKVESVFLAAHQLEVSALSTACVNLLEKNVSPANCLGFMELADLYSLGPLQDECQNMLIHNFEEVSKHQEFLGSPVARVLELLTCELLQVPEEVRVESALRWVHHRPADRKYNLKELLEQMRLPLLDPAFFTGTLEADELVLDCRDCRPLLHEARMYRVYGREVSSPRTRPRRLSLMEMLNPITGDWISSVALPGYPKSEFAACELQNHIYISGGQLNSADVWRFMSHINQWVRVRGLCRGRWRHKMVSLQGKLYVVGGFNGCERLSAVECYNPHENTWTSVCDLLLAVSSAAAVTCDGKLYSISGAVSDHANTDKVQCYDPVTNSWTYVTSCPFSQRSLSAVSLHGSIYVTGGLLNELFCYTPSTDVWTSVAVLPIKMEACGLTVCDGKVYVVGGRDESSSAVDHIWDFHPTTGKLTVNNPLPRCLSHHGCVTITQRTSQ